MYAGDVFYSMHRIALGCVHRCSLMTMLETSEHLSPTLLSQSQYQTAQVNPIQRVSRVAVEEELKSVVLPIWLIGREARGQRDRCKGPRRVSSVGHGELKRFWTVLSLGMMMMIRSRLLVLRQCSRALLVEVLVRR